jgi:ABC-type polysaccharide/polyol phosphate transport system ATPase subunit
MDNDTSNIQTNEVQEAVVDPSTDYVANMKTMEEDEDILIDVRDVSMRFRLPAEKIDSLKEYFIKLVKGKIKHKDFWVLNDINLQVRKGESLAIIGRNGAGKSTLLRLIAGIMQPTTGTIRTKGVMAPLLNLGAGFDTNATGRENIFLNGAILGFSKKEMEQKYDGIVEFSELEKFMDVPIKNYSSGMLARLGFSIAVDVSPDILIVDEILSVGDAPFRKKCNIRIKELQEKGATFIVVSHSMQTVCQLCNRAVWIGDGTIVQYGDVDTVTAAYTEWCNTK